MRPLHLAICLARPTRLTRPTSALPALPASPVWHVPCLPHLPLLHSLPYLLHTSPSPAAHLSHASHAQLVRLLYVLLSTWDANLGRVWRGVFNINSRSRWGVAPVEKAEQFQLVAQKMQARQAKQAGLARQLPFLKVKQRKGAAKPQPQT